MIASEHARPMTDFAPPLRPQHWMRSTDSIESLSPSWTVLTVIVLATCDKNIVRILAPSRGRDKRHESYCDDPHYLPSGELSADPGKRRV